MPISPQPAIESHEVSVDYDLNPGASERQVEEMATKLEGMGLQALESLGGRNDIEGVRMEMGTPAPLGTSPLRMVTSWS